MWFPLFILPRPLEFVVLIVGKATESFTMVWTSFSCPLYPVKGMEVTGDHCHKIEHLGEIAFSYCLPCFQALHTQS